MQNFLLENVPSLSGASSKVTWSRKRFLLMLGACMTLTNAYWGTPQGLAVFRFRSAPGATGCLAEHIQLTTRKVAMPFYETSLARSRANSWSEIEPDFLSRSSFSISSATLKPTARRSSSRACCACWLVRSAMPRDWVIR